MIIICFANYSNSLILFLYLCIFGKLSIYLVKYLSFSRLRMSQKPIRKFAKLSSKWIEIHSAPAPCSTNPPWELMQTSSWIDGTSWDRPTPTTRKRRLKGENGVREELPLKIATTTTTFDICFSSQLFQTYRRLDLLPRK